MTNGVRVITVMNRKGGAGKSTICKALASAAAARGETVTIFDTDSSRSCYMWMLEGQAQGNWSDKVNVVHSLDANVIANAISSITDMQDQEHLVLIDTFGGGSEAQDTIVAMSDLLISPMMLSRGDFEEVKATALWYVNLGKRVDNPDALPAFAVMFNRVSQKASDAEKTVAKTVYETLPALKSFLLQRAAYIRMDAEGLLNVIHEKMTNRALAQHLQNALEEADGVLTEIDAFLKSGGQ